MPFGIVGRTGPWMRQAVGFGDRCTGRGTFEGEFGARHCNQWGLYDVRVRQRRVRPSSQITLGRLVVSGGVKGGMRPGRHCAGGGVWRGENMEF